ncbi:porin family protein [Tenacibaculum sp. SG-28]|uniref:porin family protein n=1 Tax=Tenacibaculum sp. SG-28 TaxID=754426 RepID=UPI000CF4D279|nr:porin family protein [Tenacibaculum sp. SG-28]PQJ21570.1 hypothetical protein BSU00_05520 [Tenacibaculum sp. SG-28]
MKKQLFFLSLVILSTFHSFSQDTGYIEFGGNIGLSFTNISTMDGQYNKTSRKTFTGGITGEYYFSDRWGLKTKLIYDSKGWGDGSIKDNDDNEITTDFKLNYLTVPVMANYHFGSNRNWYLNFGPYIGFLITAEDSELGIDLKDGFNGTDFGLAFGIGYKFELNTNTKMFIELDGQEGFIDIFEMNEGKAIRNGRSSVNLGLLFNL